MHEMKGLDGSNPLLSANQLLERAGNCRHLALVSDEPHQPALRRELKVRPQRPDAHHLVHLDWGVQPFDAVGASARNSK
jgi:hypothetical protein